MTSESENLIEQEDPMISVQEELWNLAQQFRLAKLAEDLEKTKRVAIEEQIALLIPGKETGQETMTLANGSKLVVKRGLNYKADLNGVKSVIAECNDRGMGLSLPIEARATRTLDVAGYEWYKVKYPEIFAQMAEHVTVTPKKVSVVLKPAKGK